MGEPTDLSGEISLPVLDDKGTPRVRERVPVEVLGPNHFRLLHSPGLVEGLARGDEVALDEYVAGGFRVLRRSGYLNVWFFFAEDVVPAIERRLHQEIQSLGGHLDGGTRSSLIFNVPISTGFSALATLFERYCRENEGTSWMFANVYDPVDGKTPLNWW